MNPWLPRISPQEVVALMPNVKVVGAMKAGGQKIFYPIEIEGQKYGAKFLRVNPDLLKELEDQQQEDIMEAVKIRAEREFETMASCSSPFLISPGPISISTGQVGEQIILYFTEEFIHGMDLSEEIKVNGLGSNADLLNLGRNIQEGISELWKRKKVHRDIKPQNIMKCSVSGKFILLDMGLVFEFNSHLTTKFGFIPGTRAYYSPEHTDFKRRRDMDFRSDLFCLGITMYEYATGQHPFVNNKFMNEDDIVNNILNLHPEDPKKLNSNLNEELVRIIMKLLSKKPHLRYRNLELLTEDFDQIEGLI